MKKAIIVIIIGLTIVLTLTGCSQNADESKLLEDKISVLEEENFNLVSKNESLSVEKDNLQKQLNELNLRIEKEKKEKELQEEDIVVGMSDKSQIVGEYNQEYVGFEFEITNNTDKSIKGVQGVATFKDLFGVDILTMGCDFTGITIESGATVSVDDLFFDCNQFMDDHMKLYNTAYDDLNFDYQTTAIVFTDGTSKK